LANSDLLLLGKIVGPWGHKGEVKLAPYADLKQILPDREGLYSTGGKTTLFRGLEGFRFHKSWVLLKFRGFEDYRSAEELAGLEVGILRRSAPSLPPDTYYHYDLIGLKVMEGQLCRGVVTEIWTGPANDILVVEEEGQEWLLPAAKEVIRKVDVDKGELQVELPAGLRDLEKV